MRHHFIANDIVLLRSERSPPTIVESYRKAHELIEAAVKAHSGAEPGAR
jgi:hypothetical protein